MGEKKRYCKKCGSKTFQIVRHYFNGAKNESMDVYQCTVCKHWEYVKRKEGKE